MRRLIFYNLFHNGDIHFTRPFIRDIMTKTKDSFDEYHYLHYNSPRLLMDIPFLKFGRPDTNCRKKNIILRVNDDIYVNVHIGCYDFLWDDDVDNEEHSVIDTYHKLFTYIYQKIGIKIGVQDEYVPVVNYKIYKTQNIDEFVEKNKLPKIMIHNGPVQSNQFTDIDFTRLVDEISEEFGYLQFITTHKIPSLANKVNVIYSGDVFKIQEDGDLNEVSYLSKFCNVIFGRPSGPYTFCLVEENIKDKEKVFIGLSYKLRWISHGTKSTCKYVWINTPDYNSIYNILKDEIKDFSPLTPNDFEIRVEDNKIFVIPKVDIRPEDDLDISFYLDGMKKFEHKNFVCSLGMQYWFQPFQEYNSEFHRIAIEFRTTKNLLFSVRV